MHYLIMQLQCMIGSGSLFDLSFIPFRHSSLTHEKTEAMRKGLASFPAHRALFCLQFLPVQSIRHSSWQLWNTQNRNSRP